MSEYLNKDHLIELYKMFDEERRFRMKQQWTFVAATIGFLLVLFKLGFDSSLCYKYAITLLSLLGIFIAWIIISRIDKIYKHIMVKMNNIRKDLGPSKYFHTKPEESMLEHGFGTKHFLLLILATEQCLLWILFL